MREYVCVCVRGVYICVCWAWGVMVVVVGLQAILPKMLQLSPRLNSAEW